MHDPLGLIDLLLRGQHGWIVIALGGLATALLGNALLRLRRPRPSTQAFTGAAGRMTARGRREADALLNAFERFYTQLSRIKTDLETRRDTLPNVAERILIVSDHMRRECQRLRDLNIAFSRERDQRRFLARIERERGKAANLHKAASEAKLRIARRRALAAPRRRAG